MHLKESPAGSKPAFILNARVAETSILEPVNYCNMAVPRMVLLVVFVNPSGRSLPL